jgi:nanoRNase/pAp phosphatase (c-di-AMP/oligoRNAs hydrolase)
MFQRSVADDPKEATYWDNRKRVEGRVRDLASQLGGGGHWDATALQHLQTWTKLHEVDRTA